MAVAGPILIQFQNTISPLVLDNNEINDLNWWAGNKIWQNFHLILDNVSDNRPWKQPYFIKLAWK